MRYLAFLSTFLFLFYSCSENAKTIKPEYKDIVESVYSSVTIVPEDYYTVNSSVNGIIEQIFIEVGDSVIVGDNLLNITNTSVKRNEDNARLSYQLAKDKLNGNSGTLSQIEKKIDLAKIQMNNDSENYTRQKNLWDKNVGSKVEFEAKKLKYDVSKNQYQSLLSEYELAKKELNTQYQIASNQFENNSTNANDYKILSKLNGKVYELKKSVGEWVNMNEALAIVGSSNSFIIEMDVDERDISKIKLGQKVLLILNAFGDEVLEATVSKIHPKLNRQSQTFLIEARFNGVQKQLYMGLSGEANILVSETKKGIVIPKSLIKDNKVQTENGWVAIKTGISNLTEIEIISGIDTITNLLPISEE